jgi:hypothetical protein
MVIQGPPIGPDRRGARVTNESNHPTGMQVPNTMEVAMRCRVGVGHVEAAISVARCRKFLFGCIAFAGLISLVTGANRAWAQAPAPAEAADEPRSMGLPPKAHWTFNFDAGWGFFGFANSLYANVKPDPVGDLSDNWMESFVKPAISASWQMKKGELYGKASAVGERTYYAPPPLVGVVASSFQADDAYLGWRSGKSMGSTENLLDVTVGRAPYKLGRGMLLYDGASEGGSRGGFWSNARKAWEFAAIARVKPKNNTIEGFYLDRDEVPESITKSRLWGANYELALGEKNTLGATYMKFSADKNVLPARDGLNVYDVRAFTSPVKKLPGLAVDAEYAQEENGDLRSSTAWNAQASYELSKAKWAPRFSYRYAIFGGDDPATTKNEGFDSLYPGFSDWGAWWQGEIAGEYFLGNSNLVSNQVRVHVKPSDAVGAGLIGYSFKLDKLPASVVTSKDIASELDAYTDWQVNKNFLLSFVGAFANPQKAAEQAYGRTSDIWYGMVYVAYSY